MSDKNATVAVYDTHALAEMAIKKLQQHGVNMRMLSIVGKDYTPRSMWSGTTTRPNECRPGAAAGRSGAESGESCLAPHSSGYRASGRFSWGGRSLP